MILDGFTVSTVSEARSTVTPLSAFWAPALRRRFAGAFEALFVNHLIHSISVEFSRSWYGSRSSMRAMCLPFVPLLLSAGCIITDTTQYDPQAPLTVPVIQDIQGLTTPRLGNLIEVERSDSNPTVEFRVPVDDDGLNDPLQFQFIVNGDRDCIALDGGSSCEPSERLGEIPPNGSLRRIITRTLTMPAVGCNRVELWVSSNLPLSGNFHTPARRGDIAFTTWWVFVRARPGDLSSDAGAGDPVSRCRYQVQP